MEVAEAKLNDKFLSPKIEDLISFYSFFGNRGELIDWMRNRPKNEPSIINVDGETDIVVIIPTANVNSSRSQTCSREIYKGLNQIFVESVKPRDSYFNYSHNVNLGVQEALKLDPEWIIISNDDMLLQNGPNQLITEIRKHDFAMKNVLFTNPPGDYHSFLRFIGEPTFIYSMLSAAHPNRNRHTRLKLWRKYQLKYIDALYSGPSGFLSRITYRSDLVHLLTGSFTVLSMKYVRNQEKLLDETFVNGGEDTDLSLRLYQEPDKIGYINYKVGDQVGTSLGSGWPRILRNVVNEIYLSYKIEKGILPLKSS